MVLHPGSVIYFEFFIGDIRLTIYLHKYIPLDNKHHPIYLLKYIP